MSRTRREYTDGPGQLNQFTFTGEYWIGDTPADNLTQDGKDSYQTVDLTNLSFGSITLGQGNSSQTFSQITLWQDGVISFGAPTSAQIAFMAQFNGSQSIDQFPGNYISAGYTDQSSAGDEISYSLGWIAFDKGADGTYHFADAVPVLRVTWGSGKQIIFTASDFTIGDTNYDNQGAGYGLGHDWVDGSIQTIPVTVDYGSYITGAGSNFDYVKGDFSGAGQSLYSLAR
jgi:hypothetical protein